MRPKYTRSAGIAPCLPLAVNRCRMFGINLTLIRYLISELRGKFWFCIMHSNARFVVQKMVKESLEMYK